jgi:replicative DNA helicase
MKRIKNLAVEENIPIMVLSQLNREIEKRTDDSKPKMTDLRDSGVLEQAADIVIFINRPEQQGKTKDVNGESLAGIGFLKVAKNRNGSTGITRFRYNENMTRLSDY